MDGIRAGDSRKIGEGNTAVLGKKRPREEKSTWTAQWKDAKLALVELTQKNSSVSIAGRGSVRCLHGCVWGHGFLMQVGVWYPFDCPYWSSWLVLHSESDSAKLEVRDREMGKPADGEFVPPESHDPMLPPHLTKDDSPSFSLYDTDNPSSRPTHVLPEWRDTADRILKDPNPTSEGNYQNRPNMIAVAGAKGVGKSTFVRYLIHRFLSQQQPVYVLDGDTGQAEFGPPGLLTLTFLEQIWPLWSLPHHHMLSGGVSNPKNPLAPPGAKQTALFFGGVTSELAPGRYLESLSHLVSHFRDTSACGTAAPLVVNLDGWIKGLGFQVLSSFLSSHAPSHIVQINGTNATQQVDLSGAVPASLSCVHTLPSFSSVSGTTVSPALSVPASAWRDLRYVQYWLDDPCFEVGFSQNDLIRDSDGVIACRLASQKPYMVPWDSVRCQTADGAPLLPELLNGCVVGLCLDGPAGRPSGCVGLGIIRSVDLSKCMFYVLTPVPPRALPSVTVFVVGNLCLPITCTNLGDKSFSFPFQAQTSVSTNIIGSMPMKSRKNILRKGVNA